MMFTKSFRLLGMLIGLAIASYSANATLVYYDGLNYTVGQPLNGQTGWGHLNTSAGTNNQVLIVSPGLTSVSGLQTAVGNAAALVSNTTASNSEDLGSTYTTPITAGAVYVSFLAKVTAVGTSYFISYNGAGATTLPVRVFAVSDGSAGVKFGTSVNASSPASTDYTGSVALGSTNLIVMKFDYATSRASIFLNPSAGAAEPAASAIGSTTASVTTIKGFQLREGSTGGPTGDITIDEIRAGTTWADVTPAAPVVDDPNISVAGSLNFPAISSGTSETVTLVIGNTGASNQLTIQNTSSITGTNAGLFSIVTALPLSINANSTAALVLRFNPAGASGAAAATLNLASNDTSNASTAVALTGSATDNPNLSVTSPLNFGTISADASKTVALQLTNTGLNASLNVTAGAITGAGASKFSVVSGIPATIAPGASSSVMVKFTPAFVTGKTSATLTLTSNDQSNASIAVRLDAIATGVIYSGYDYLHPTPSVIATNAQLLTYAGIASGTFIPLCITLDNDGGLLVLLEESNTVGSTSQPGNGGALIKISADGTSHSVIVMEPAIIAALTDNTTLNDINPNGLQVGADGTIYLSEFGASSNEVVKITRPANTVTKLATVPGIGSMKYDPANNRLLFCQVSAFGASDNLVTAVSVSDGTLTPVITSAELATMTGLTGTPELQPFIIDPENSANLIGFIETSFGGNDSMIRINNYNNSATRTASVIAASTAWPTLPGYTPMVGADGVLFGMETNASGGVPTTWRFTTISPLGTVYTINSDDLDILFGFTGANTNDDTQRDVYPKNIAELAAKKVGSNIEVFLASATGQRGIFKLTYAPIVAVNKAKNWNIME